ncbi:MAG: HAMP domain-containing protein [Candidatus Rokubacteria bacterium]|nr:HAMP domain-containing protein [Candidatus Rokubacteria bacterium]
MFRSIVTKNVLLFLAILLVAIVPLAVRYDMDSRAYEIQNLAARLEFFAERGVAWLDVDDVAQIRTPADRESDGYRSVLETLQRIESEFEVDNAVLMRRQPDGRYVYIAIGHDDFDPGEPAGIHRLFPATYKATEDTWQAGEMMHSQLFGGQVAGEKYNQFVQINIPLKEGDDVVAILMLNKFANPVADAVRMKTLRVVMLSIGLVAAGLVLFGFVSARMLKPLRTLTVAAGQVSEGNLDVVLPPARTRDEVGRLTGAFAGMIDGLRQRDFIRDTFGRYVTKEVVDELLGSPDGLRLGGESRTVTILVTDLRGFTALASALPPKDVLEILNRYLARMVAVIQKHRGTVDEIQGDGILAFFGAPLGAADDPARAVACAIEMQLALDGFNAEQRAAGRPEVGMGIGVNTGEVIIGNIGSEQRTKYGAVGSAINMAYRIESYTVGGQIFLSPETYERVHDVVRLRGTVTAEFKGLDRPLTLYDVAGIGGEYLLALPHREEDVFHPVEPPLPIACFAIDGKTVSAAAVHGSLTRLGASGADVALGERPAPHANVKLVLVPGTPDAGEVYAKVASAAADKPDDVRVVFTSVSDAARRRLDALRQGA